MKAMDAGRRRAGVALVAALGAIIVIGIILSGVVFVSTQEARAASGMFGQERAFRAAEAGLNTAVATWNSTATATLPVGSVHTQSLNGSGWTAVVRSTKLTPDVYSVLSTSIVHPGTAREARKSTALAIRLSPPQFNLLGALTVRGNMRIGGSSFVSGHDVAPPSWSNCPATQPTKPGIVQGLTGETRWQGCPSLSCVEGSPKFQLSEEADSLSTYFEFGDLDWDALTAMADKVYPGTASVGSIAPVESGGVCNTGVQNNWGQPLNTTPAGACENYFPIIHFKGAGTAKITSGGSGQGILLVDDNLEISGGLEFYGIVIVRNTITTTGNGGRVRGGLMAANLNLEENTVLGDATVRYSSCAIERVSAGAAIPIRIAGRAWAEMH
jgi:hypothetical protein